MRLIHLKINLMMCPYRIDMPPICKQKTRHLNLNPQSNYLLEQTQEIDHLSEIVLPAYESYAD